MNRRTILLALGAAAVLTGIVFGTGAFTQVEADRNVTVNVSDDSDAFLALEQAPANSEYVTNATGGAGRNVVEISLDDTSGASGLGVNDNAVTNVTPVLNVTNQGTQPVDVTVSGAPEGVNLTNIPVNNLAVDSTAQVGVIVVTGNASDSAVTGSINTTTNLNEAITIRAEANSTAP